MHSEIAAADAAHTILFSHGNAEDIGDLSRWLPYLSQALGANIVWYDYEGYGLHDGSCSEAKCYDNVQSVYRYLTDACNVPPHLIVLCGRSLGSGPATFLAEKLSARERSLAKKKRPSDSSSSTSASASTSASDSATSSSTAPPLDDSSLSPASDPLPTTAASQSNGPVLYAALILLSPIASAVRVVSHSLSFIPFLDSFPNHKRITKITRPCLVIHGDLDQVVPYAHGKLLSESTPHLHQFVTIANRGHNDIESSPDSRQLLIDSIASLLQALPR
eukprot:TRINITY_DN21989_c0_g1_i1.p1 TRINITY_DN21989_c0_g1~~TRINITY_DN21989_c0_g1_i1.p1  ORF type:complete len:276 (+),score=31.87 TRINITY_DN21989_c0_g1_i1:2-829(+)